MIFNKRLIRLTADPSDEPKGCYTRKVLRFHIFVHYTVSLKLEVVSQRGIIASLATTIAAAGANILKIDIGDREGQLASVDLDLMVENRIHLARVIKKLRVLKSVNRVNRT